MCGGFRIYCVETHRSSPVNLFNEPTILLQKVFAVNDPCIYYCTTTSTNLKVPSVVADAHKLLGPVYSLVILNCSQELSNAQNIFATLRINSSWEPTVFIKAPWISARQIHPSLLRDGTTLAEYIQDQLEPLAEEVRTDADLQKACGLDKICIAIVKGLRFTSVHNNIIKQIIMTYPNTRVVIIDASKRRLSVESRDLLPENFTIKVYVLNSNYFRKMTAAPTILNIQTFLFDAMLAPLTSFYGNGTMKLIDAHQKKN